MRSSSTRVGIGIVLVAVAVAVAIPLAMVSAATRPDQRGHVATRPAASITPGTPKQVAALVTAAPSINQLPSNVTPPLSSASNDDPLHAYKNLTPCISGTDQPTCLWGDPHGKRTMVLFGDSHALMWFPAVDAVAKAAKWRLIVHMYYGCPVADVTVWNIATNAPNSGCPNFRKHTIGVINRLHPALVIVSESFFPLDAKQHTITPREWTYALVRSFRELHVRHKVLIGESFLIPYVLGCLAANPSAIQTCSMSDGAKAFQSEVAADKAAAKSAKVAYVNEIPWICSTTCTGVIGRMIVYYSDGHLSTTYARYLTDVLRLALKPSMP